MHLLRHKAQFRWNICRLALLREFCGKTHKSKKILTVFILTAAAGFRVDVFLWSTSGAVVAGMDVWFIGCCILYSE
jgi:hypothetical protein